MKGTIKSVAVGDLVFEGGDHVAVDINVTIVGSHWALDLEHVPVADGIVPGRQAEVVEVDGRLTVEPVR